MNARLFFDPERAKGPSEAPEVAAGQPGGRPPGASPLTVSALLAVVKDALSQTLPRRVMVVGEISNFKQHSSGHMYFSLKDGEGQIAAVMFRNSARGVKFRPSDGLEVIAEGRVDIFEAQGKLQLYVESLSPKGAGALELAYRQLVEKLRGEGLFDAGRKRALPRCPQTICIITSPTGAAIRDIRRTLGRRWPAATAYLIPVSVQGASAAGEISRAIELASANAAKLGIDVVIVGRGGGSIEDLWCFNEESVARAIFACRVPVVSGVGHETDTTIADLVADVRAATPTAAAEMATPDCADLTNTVRQLTGRLERRMRERLAGAKTHIRLAERSEFFRNPLHRVHSLHQRLDELAQRLRSGLVQRHVQYRGRLADIQAALRWHLGGLAKRKSELLAEHDAALRGANPMQRILLSRGKLDSQERHLATLVASRKNTANQSLLRYARMLEALSYRSVLKRGFSVTRGPEGKIIRGPGEVSAGDRLRTELAQGEIRSVVEGGLEQPRRRRKSAGEGGDQPALFE